MKNLNLWLIVLGIGVFLTSSVGIAEQQLAEQSSKVVLASEIKWQALNPARGDKSPKAATLWGDRSGASATGFLVNFVDGFKSPPHIHNVTYRGVVISGLIHNDDPAAEAMWMPKGSFWTQPAGEVHITAAKGKNNVAFIEIDKGPYLVLPTEKAFDSGERPVNVDAKNIVWLDASSTSWIDSPENTDSADGPKIAFLWGNPLDEQLNGTLVNLPFGFTGEIRGSSSILRSVVIQGHLKLRRQSEIKVLEPGSFFSSKDEFVHQLSCKDEKNCLIYVQNKGKYKIIPIQEGNK